MGIHTVMYYDEPDACELVEIDYQCSRSCMIDTLAREDITVDDPSIAGTINGEGENAGSISWGAWPGGSETDYAVYCSGCGELLWEGMNE